MLAAWRNGVSRQIAVPLNRHLSTGATLVAEPSKRLAVVTCMDARINPFEHFGLKKGEAHVIRNAGGIAKDALRSLIISQHCLGTREIAVYQHTGCGLFTFEDEGLRKQVRQTAGLTARPDQCEHEHPSLDGVDFCSTKHLSLEESVKESVDFLRTCPLLFSGTKVSGWIWDVTTEKLRHVI